jgi:hypothetical protein
VAEVLNGFEVGVAGEVADAPVKMESGLGNDSDKKLLKCLLGKGFKVFWAYYRTTLFDDGLVTKPPINMAKV